MNDYLVTEARNFILQKNAQKENDAEICSRGVVDKKNLRSFRFIGSENTRFLAVYIMILVSFEHSYLWLKAHLGGKAQAFLSEAHLT